MALKKIDIANQSLSIDEDTRALAVTTDLANIAPLDIWNQRLAIDPVSRALAVVDISGGSVGGLTPQQVQGMIDTSIQAALSGLSGQYIPYAYIGAPDGVAALDAQGNLPGQIVFYFGDIATIGGWVPPMAGPVVVTGTPAGNLLLVGDGVSTVSELLTAGSAAAMSLPHDQHELVVQAVIDAESSKTMPVVTDPLSPLTPPDITTTTTTTGGGKAAT